MAEITGELLRQLLYEEFKRDNWGDLDPDYFNPAIPENEMGDMKGLSDVIDRVAERLNKK